MVNIFPILTPTSPPSHRGAEGSPLRLHWGDHFVSQDDAFTMNNEHLGDVGSTGRGTRARVQALIHVKLVQVPSTAAPLPRFGTVMAHGSFWQLLSV